MIKPPYTLPAEMRMAQYMADMDITIAEPVIADGKLRRFHVKGDRPGTRNGWYVLFAGRSMAGKFGSWKTQQSYSWHETTRRDWTTAERMRFRQETEKAEAEFKQEQQQRADKAAEKSAEIWERAAPATCDHSYLLEKDVGVYGLAQIGDALLVPVVSIDLKIISLQFIYSDGRKRFLSGGVISGGFHWIGELYDTLYIAEGYASGATAHESTGHAVVVAFNCGNLMAVAKAIRKEFPWLKIIIAGDNDWHREDNPGYRLGLAAATAIGADFIAPEFPAGVSGTDFNDWVRGWDVEE